MIEYLIRSLKDEKLVKIENFKKGCWISVVDPSEKELKDLVDEYNLDEKNLLAGLDKNELPRVEFINKDVYIFFKIIPSDNKKELHTLLVIITENFILILSKYKPGFIDNILEGKIEFITTQKLKCLLKIMSMINKEFEKATSSTVRLVNSKRKAFSELTNEDITDLLEQEEILNSFISSYQYTGLVYDRVLTKLKFFEQDKGIIEDLMIEAKQDSDLCKSSLKTILNIRDHFVVLLSNKLNKVITLLTVFTVFISVPAAVSGIYGMNVLLPFQDNPTIFGYIVLFIGLIWLVFLWYFNKMKIL